MPSSTSISFSSPTSDDDTPTVHCSGTGNSYQSIGSLPRTTCTPQLPSHNLSFSWTALGPPFANQGGGNGAVLGLFDSKTNQRATRIIPSEELVWENERPNPNGRVQVYDGPSTFTVRPIVSYGGDGGDAEDEDDGLESW